MAVSEVDVGKLVVRLLLNDEQYNKAAADAAGTARQLAADIGPLVDMIGNALTTAFKLAAVAATGLAAASTAVGASFEKQMAQLAAVAGGLTKTDEAYQRLKARAEEMGATTQFSATQAAEGMTALAQAGLSTDQVIQAIQPALDLAVASQIGLGEATEIVASTMKQFGLQASDAAHITDVLAQGTQASLLSMQDLAVSMRYAGSASAGVGISLEETVAVLAQFRDLGLDAEQVGTNYRAMISSLSDPTKEATATLERLGLSAAQVSPELNSLKDVLKSLGESSMTTADAFSIFGVQAGANVAAIANGLASSSADFDQLLVDLQTKSGALAGMVAVQTDTVAAAWDEVTSAAESAGIALFDGFAEPLRVLLSESQAIILQIADEFRLQSARIGAEFTENLTGLGEDLGTTVGRALVELAVAALDLAGAVRTIGEAVAPLLPYFDDLLVLLTSVFAVGRVIVWGETVATTLAAMSVATGPVVAAMVAFGVAVTGVVATLRDLENAEVIVAEANREAAIRMAESGRAATAAANERAQALIESTIAARDAAAAEGSLSSELRAAAEAARTTNAELLTMKLRLGEVVDAGGRIMNVRAVFEQLDEAGVQGLANQAAQLRQEISSTEARIERLRRERDVGGRAGAGNLTQIAADIRANEERLSSLQQDYATFQRNVEQAQQDVLAAEQKRVEESERKKAATRQANQEAQKAETRSHLDELNRLLSQAEEYGLSEVERIELEKKRVMDEVKSWRVASAEQLATVETLYDKKIADAKSELLKKTRAEEEAAALARHQELMQEIDDLDAARRAEAAAAEENVRIQNDKLNRIEALRRRLFNSRLDDLEQERDATIFTLRSEGLATAEFIAQVSGAFDEMINAEKAAILREEIGKVGDTARQVATTISDVVNGIAQVYETAINIVRTSVNGFFSLIESLSGFRFDLFGFVREAQGLVSSGEARDVGTAGAGLVTSAATQAVAFVNAVVDAAPEIMAALGDALPELLQAIADAAPQVAAAVAGAIPAIIQTVAENLGPIITALVDAADQIIQALTEGIDVLVTALLDAFEENAARSVEMMNALVEALIVGLGDLIVGLIESLPRVLDALLEGVPRIIKAFIDAVGDIIAEIIRSIPDVIRSILEALPDIIISIVDGIIELIPKLISAIIEMIPELIQALVQAIPDLIVELVNGLTDLLSKDSLPKLLNDFIQSLPTLINALIEGFVGGLPEIIPALVSAIVQSIVSVLTNFGELLSDIGMAIFQPKKYAEKYANIDAQEAAAEVSEVDMYAARQEQIRQLAMAAENGDMAALAQLYSLLSAAEARGDATHVDMLKAGIEYVRTDGATPLEAMGSVSVSAGSVSTAEGSTGTRRTTADREAAAAAYAASEAGQAAHAATADMGVSGFNARAPVAVAVKIDSREIGQALIDAQNQGRLGGLQGRLGGGVQAVGMAPGRPVIR